MSRTILLGKKGRTIEVDFGAFPTDSRQPVSLLYHGELLLHQQPATSHVFISFQKDVQSAVPGPGAPEELMYLHRMGRDGEKDDRPPAGGGLRGGRAGGGGSPLQLRVSVPPAESHGTGFFLASSAPAINEPYLL